MIDHSGWLLDAYPAEDGLALWLLGEDGTRRRLRQLFPLTFYAAGPPERLRAAWRWLQRRPEKPTLQRAQRRDLFSPAPLDVLAVTVQNPLDQPTLFNELARLFPERAALTYYDADLHPALRHAARYGSFPLARCRARCTPSGEVLEFETLDSPWDLDPPPAPLRLLGIEPDCDPFYAPPRALRLRTPAGERTLSLQPARALLVNLRALLERWDPDVLLTAWGDTWLLPHLLELCQETGLELPLNRDPRSPIVRRPERSYFAYGQIVYRGAQVLLAGRWHIDAHNAVLFHDYGLDGVLEMARVSSLPAQSAARLSPGSGISAMQVVAALRQGILVPWHKQQVERPKSALDLLRADMGGLVYQPLVGVHGDVAEIDFISMYPGIMVRYNISPETVGQTRLTVQLAPRLELFPPEAPAGAGQAALTPSPGVCAAAPFPSPIGRGEGEQDESPGDQQPGLILQTLAPPLELFPPEAPAGAGQAALTPSPGVCAAAPFPSPIGRGEGEQDESPGLIPQTLAPLLEKRIALKARLAETPAWHPRRRSDQARASAHKWLLVTCFGYLGYKNARFGRIEAHEAVTAYGREALLRAKEAAEDLGFEVLHLYVDGMWVRRDGARRVEDFQPLIEQISLRTELPVALDGIYRWVAFLPSRRDERISVANRYFGVFQDGSLKLRGIEARRRDTPPFVARAQLELLELLATAESAAGLPALLPQALALLRGRLALLHSGRLPPAELLAAQKLSRELERYRDPSPAARAALQLAEVGKRLRPGQSVRFIYTLGKPGVYAWGLPEPFDPRSVDVRRYATLLVRAAAAVLFPLGVSEAELDALLRLASAERSLSPALNPRLL